MGTEDMLGNHDGEIQGELWTQGRWGSAFAVNIESTGPCRLLDISLDVSMNCKHWKDSQPPFYLTS